MSDSFWSGFKGTIVEQTGGHLVNPPQTVPQKVEEAHLAQAKYENIKDHGTPYFQPK